MKKQLISSNFSEYAKDDTRRYLINILSGMIFVLLVGLAGTSRAYTAEYTNDEGTYRISFQYSDSMFLTSPNGNNNELEKASLAMASLAYTNGYDYPNKLLTLIGQMGFTNNHCVNYLEHYSYDDCNHVAFVTAEKEFTYNGERYAIILCVIRGTVGFNAEWFSNFNVGTGMPYMHEGFAEAADEPFRLTKGRLEQKRKVVGNDHTIAWITGHSRGAAVSNIVSGYLCHNTENVLSKHVFSYNFACPTVGASVSTTLENVHNYNNPYDAIPVIIPESWGFMRNGQNYDVSDNFYNTDFEYHFEMSHNRELKTTRTDIVQNMLESIASTREDMNDRIKHLVVDLVVRLIIANNTDVRVDEIFRKYSPVADFSLSISDFVIDVVKDPVQVLGDLISSMVDWVSENRLALSTSIIGANSTEDYQLMIDFVEAAITELNRIKEDFSGQLQGLNDGHTPETYMQWIGGNNYSYTVKKELPSVYRIPDGVTTLVSNQFANNTNLTKVIIPSSVKTIKAGCFSYCNSLEEVVFEGNVDYIGMGCFERCPKLRSIRFGGTVAEIGIGAFRWCPELYDLQIPGGLTELAAELFCADSKLESITIPDGITKIGSACFNGCPIKTINVPDSVIEIDDYAFGACFSLTEVHLSNSLTSISDELFAYCSALSKVNIPSGVSRIGDRAFRECTQIKSLNFIPYNVSTIGEGAFESCTGLESIQLGNNIQSIGSGAFSGCTNLRSAVLPTGIETIDFFSWCTSLTDVTIPSSVRIIGDYAFDHCYALTNLIIPRSITSIGNYSFYGCNNLENMVIQDKVNAIGDNALSSCSKLNVYVYNNPTVEAYLQSNNIPYVSLRNVLTAPDLKMPMSLNSIEDESFEGNSASSIYIGDQVQFIGQRAFANCCNLKQIRISAGAYISSDAFYNSINGILIVYGKAGSAAESFAAANKQVFFIYDGN